MLNASALYIPTFIVVLGVVLNWLSNNSMRGEFSTLRGEFHTLRGEFHSLRGEMTTLRADVLSEIGDLKDANHKDALEIMRQMTSLHERVAVVESRQTK